VGRRDAPRPGSRRALAGGAPAGLPAEPAAAASRRDCAWLDGELSLTGRGNYEILVEWLAIATASDYEPVFPRVREVLTTVGRMKYLRPLYGALGTSARTRRWGGRSSRCEGRLPPALAAGGRLGDGVLAVGLSARKGRRSPMKFLLSLVITALALAAAAHLVPGSATARPRTWR